MSTPTAGPDDRSPTDEELDAMLEDLYMESRDIERYTSWDTNKQNEAESRAAVAMLRERILSALRSARRDVARLDAFAAMLERSAGTKLDGLIEVTFAVDLPDGGSVSVGFGVNDRHSAGSAADALRAALDARIPASSPPILEKNDRG